MHRGALMCLTVVSKITGISCMFNVRVNFPFEVHYQFPQWGKCAGKCVKSGAQVWQDWKALTLVWAMVRDDAEVFPLWFELQLLIMVNKSQGGFFLYGDTFRSPKLDVCWFYSGETGRAGWGHISRRYKAKTSRPPLLPPSTPERRRFPSSPSPHTLRSTPFSLCYYEPTEECDDCARDLSIKIRARPGSISSSFPLTVIDQRCGAFTAANWTQGWINGLMELF